jgi:hypothetical protein
VFASRTAASLRAILAPIFAARAAVVVVVNCPSSTLIAPRATLAELIARAVLNIPGVTALIAPEISTDPKSTHLKLPPFAAS